MNKYLIEDTSLSSLADKIREKLGVTDTFLPSVMSGKIGEIPAGSGVYAWTRSDSSGNFVDYVVSDNETEYPENGAGSDGYMYEMVMEGPSYEIVSWADGTDEQIAAMVAAADYGLINLADYWSVGDTRTVNLSAMEATGVKESHEAQSVKMVLVHAGDYELNEPVRSGRTACSFVVHLKDTLNEKGNMNATGTNAGSWEQSARRKWCNEVFPNSIPTSLIPIFKEFKTITATEKTAETTTTSIDRFAIPAAAEIAGPDAKYCNAVEKSELFQFEWYKTTANRIKKTNGAVYVWWLRSPTPTNAYNFARINADGSVNWGSAGGVIGVAPFGVI